MKAPLPENETERLEALRHYQILDSVPEEIFDDMARLAGHVCGCSIATISIMDQDRQWYKSRVGIDLTETSRNISFCAHTLLEDRPLIVEDATLDERFADNPVVIQDPHVRFYAGVPLRNEEGYALGTLCVVDLKPRQLTPEQTLALESIGRHVMTHLELRRTLIELRLAEEEMHRLNQVLDQRTTELRTANKLLKAEIEKHERPQ